MGQALRSRSAMPAKCNGRMAGWSVGGFPFNERMGPLGPLDMYPESTTIR